MEDATLKTEQEKRSWKDRLRITRGDGENDPPPVRLLDLILVVIGVGLLISGFIMTSRASNATVTPHVQISLTALLDTAKNGQIATVSIPSTTTSATATVGDKPVTSGLATQEYQAALTTTDKDEQVTPGPSEIPAGTQLSVYIPTSVAGSVVEQLTTYQVPVWMSATAPVYSTHTVMPLRAPPQQYTGQSAGGSAIPIFMMIAGLVFLATGLIRLAMYRQRLKKAAADEEGGKGKHGKHHAQVDESEMPITRFEDVAGCDEAVESMREMVDFLTNAEAYTDLGARLPKGALLVGPPGTGKTLLARAVAGEAGVPFFSMAGSEFVEKFVGVGAQRVRDLFKAAREAGRAIIFIDEIDAVARKRSGSEDTHANTESENTLNQLLKEMDGFTGTDVIVLAATNRADILDPAITRAGRLDRRIEVPLPDSRGRDRILQVHARRLRLGDDVDLTTVAARTPGFSGAQLESVANEAALEAARRRLKAINNSCFDAAVATVAMGKARISAVVTPADRTITAWHEAGHTVAALLLADADAPVAVSIVPRGPAGGVTWMAGSDDLFMSTSKATANLIVGMSGRVAEQMLLGGEFTQGASSDLQNATEQALAMATLYGMTRLGLASRSRHLGGTSTKEVTDVVEELLDDAQSQSRKLLTDHHDLLEAIAQELLEHDDLSAADLARIAARLKVTPASKPSAPLPTSKPQVISEPAAELVPVPVPARLPLPVPLLVPAATTLRQRLLLAAKAAKATFNNTTKPKKTA